MTKPEIILTKKDYAFIDDLVKKYDIPWGLGHTRYISFAINEYKLKEIENKHLLKRQYNKRLSIIDELMNMRNVEDNLLLTISFIMIFIQFVMIFYLLIW